MNRRKLWLLGSGLIVAAILTSCHPGRKLRVINNTSLSISATAYWSPTDLKRRDLSQGSVTVFDWPSTLSVTCGSNHWGYAIPNLPTSYLEKKTFTFYLSVQVQPGGTLYALPSGARAVGTNFTAQPPGFPLLPKHAD